MDLKDCREVKNKTGKVLGIYYGFSKKVAPHFAKIGGTLCILPNANSSIYPYL